MPLNRITTPIQGLQQPLSGVSTAGTEPSYRIHWARKGKVHPMATRRKRAQELLCWLVKQRDLVTYTDVTNYLGGTPYFVTPDLKCLSDLLQELQERDRRRKIPLIQSIIIRKDTHAPGCGIAKHLDPPLTESEYLALGKKDRCSCVEPYQKKALHYPHWDRVVKGVEALPDE